MQLLFWMCALLMTSLLLVGTIGCSSQPVAELDAARDALDRAIEAQAPEVAPLIYARAKGVSLAAQQEIDVQAARWFWERNYSAAIELLTWATSDGNRAAEDAIEITGGHQDQSEHITPVGNADVT